jgi:hypothetical protein
VKARLIKGTIRPKQGHNLEGFATVIARVLPIDANGHESGHRQKLLKLYAAEGTEFYTKLLSIRDQAGPTAALDVIGIFAVDPFSILKIIEKEDFSEGAWVSVPYPVSLMVFGEF